jgi:uncharacterized protein involved in exopolysaccharide biosynthesis
LDETNGRLNIIDKQLAMLTRDVRDTRGGVTRQLVEQDKRLAAIEQRLTALEEGYASLAQMQSSMAQRMEAMQGMLEKILHRLPPR